jgi:hypothetical protein
VFRFLKALVGSAAYHESPTATGAIYLRDNLRKDGFDPDEIPAEFYSELSAYADGFAKTMAQMSSRDQPVTYFVEHLEYIQILIEKALMGESVDAPEPVANIFKRFGLPARSS